MAAITTDDAHCVASLPEEQARLKLRECLEWEPFDDEKDMRKSIHLDFLYQNLTYAVEKGFTLDQTVAVVSFANKILENIKDSKGITDTLSFYKTKSMELADTLGERNFKVYTEFIFGTVLPHFKLYQLVFTTERREDVPHLSLKVEPPFTTEALKNSKEQHVWNYEKQVEELRQKENDRIKARLTEQEAKMTKLDSQSKGILQSIDMLEAPVSKESIAGILQDVLKTYSEVTTENIKSRINETREDLEYKLEVTSLPRPQVLGPPPRFNLAQKAKTPVPPSKSPKPGSRASRGSHGSGKGKKK